MAREISIRGEDEFDVLTVAEAALRDVPNALPDIVCVGDTIDTDMQEGFLRHEFRLLERSDPFTLPIICLALAANVVFAGVCCLNKAIDCRGHGTQVIHNKLVATVCGLVERVNKLVSVRPLQQR